MTSQHIERLDQRCQYLSARIKAKQSVGWETVYDESERDALAWALDKLGQQVRQENRATPAEPYRPTFQED